jgi:uncharacterized protein (TIGR03083 family)
MADAHIAGLRLSVDRLRDIATSVEDVTGRAYPADWSVAATLSHIGSGAVIMQRRLDDILADQPTPDDFAPGVWDAWNAKSPSEQRDDALAADAALLARIEAVAPGERSAFSMAMGPLTLDFAGFVGMRLNEHALHTWDIEVSGTSSATIPAEITALVVDNLELVARFTAKPTGETGTLTVTTTEPERAFRIDLSAESVTFTPTIQPPQPDLRLPAEALARLVYGRLDPQHTPPGDHGPALENLRQVFPGP